MMMIMIYTASQWSTAVFVS